MKITVQVESRGTSVNESAVVRLTHSGLDKPVMLDLEMSPLFDLARNVPTMGTDFLFISSVVYAIDKMVSREMCAEDCWTRDLSVTIPVKHFAVWHPLEEEWSDCVSFLTGDRWRISFCQGTRKIAQRNTRKRRKPRTMAGNAVSLLSGGLDSFIGAIDWLAGNSKGKLVLVGHHDRHVKGPMRDQTRLFNALNAQFPNRPSLVQARAGVLDASAEVSFRSRSLIFLGFGVYVAELLGPDTPVIIPENGPIALNIPLSPSRRGSCSTRTVHPRFINSINEILRLAGLRHTVSNPYAFKTKGEMVHECRVPQLLATTQQFSVSCAKSGHTYHWTNRKAGACGRCVPCLFRRAALSTSDLDTQPYGFDVLDPSFPDRQYGDDFRALLAFLKRNPGKEVIAQELVCNGPVSRGDLTASVDVVLRMMDEVREWIARSGSTRVKKLVGIAP